MIYDIVLHTLVVAVVASTCFPWRCQAVAFVAADVVVVVVALQLRPVVQIVSHPHQEDVGWQSHYHHQEGVGRQTHHHQQVVEVEQTHHHQQVVVVEQSLLRDEPPPQGEAQTADWEEEGNRTLLLLLLLLL